MNHLDPRTIARILGGEVAGRNSVLCPGPGHSARDRSLSVTFAGDDVTVFSHAGDDWRECKDYVRSRLGLGHFTPSDPRPAPVIVTPTPEDRERTQRAVTIWREAHPIAGTPAEAYLASRGVSYQGEALRWHPSCPFGKERLGCMVALVRNIVTNEPQAVHRTAIDAVGKKLSHLGSNGRLSFGPVGGGAVKLTDDAEVTKVIAIGEGIETALSIRELPDLGNMPVWSVLSAGGITAFPVLPGIESVWIAADNDASGTGQKAARSAAERLNAENIETIILASTQAGADLNDKVTHHA
jgi:putative DNA primase/helicase